MGESAWNNFPSVSCVRAQVYKRKEEDADSVLGLSAGKKGGKKGKKGADRKPDQPVRTSDHMYILCDYFLGYAYLFVVHMGVAKGGLNEVARNGRRRGSTFGSGGLRN